MKKKKNGGCNPHQNRVKLIKTYEAYSDNASDITLKLFHNPLEKAIATQFYLLISNNKEALEAASR